MEFLLESYLKVLRVFGNYVQSSLKKGMKEKVGVVDMGHVTGMKMSHFDSFPFEAIRAMSHLIFRLSECDLKCKPLHTHTYTHTFKRKG